MKAGNIDVAAALLSEAHALSLIDQARAKSRTRNVTAIVHWLPHGKLKDSLDG